MADTAKPAEKKPIEDILEKLDKKHKSYQDWMQTLEVRHSDAYNVAAKKILMKDGSGVLEYSKLDKDPKARAEFAKEIVNQYMDWGKKTYGWDLKDDMMKAQGLHFVSGFTEGIIKKNLEDYKSNYSLGIHKQETQQHIKQLQGIMQEKVTDHVGEEHIDDVLAHMGVKDKVDKSKVKSNIYELRHALYGHYLKQTEMTNDFVNKYKKTEEVKKAA